MILKTKEQELILKTKNLSFIDNSWGADLTDMQLISKFNKGFQLLCLGYSIKR